MSLLHRMFTDKGYDGTSSDVWSCGVILFVLMAGYLPFDEPSLMALHRRVSLERGRLAFYSELHLDVEEEVSLDDVDAVFNDSEENLVTERKEKPLFMNAFQLISRSQGFSLENLFDNQIYTFMVSVDSINVVIIWLIQRSTTHVGLDMNDPFMMKLQGDKTGRKGQLAVATEVLEVAPSLHTVELRKAGGDTLEFHKA
ncbi:UNVERIFIED_CONTAM: CBL-interacting serine/threonine-protein kinase [Sesamum radiatum]|uniref:non-specific serine/threonine protein kinase n=1 Tax=Sesamum radiatum TaxID=300843 RepID=A0AAW2UDA6_SESRA